PGLLKKGFQVKVLDKGGELEGVWVDLLPGRSVMAAKEKERAADQPGEGLASFDLSDLDDRVNVVLHASLVELKDKFPLDDQAWLVVGVVRKARVLVAGTPNKVLHAFFDHPATTKVAAVEYLDPADLKDPAKYGQRARAGDWDLVVFDRCTPATPDDL